MKLQSRVKKGTQVRSLGMVPGVIYGKKLDPMKVQLAKNELLKALKAYGTNRVFEVDLDGKKHTVYFKDYQFNPIKHSEFLSFDLQKVSASDTMTTDVSVQLLGTEKFEGKQMLVQQILTTIECEYPVGSGVAHLELDVSNLDAGDALYVKDIALPKGFKALTDLESMVVNVTIPAAEKEPEEADALEVEEAPADAEEEA